MTQDSCCLRQDRYFRDRSAEWEGHIVCAGLAPAQEVAAVFLWERLLVGERAAMPFYAEHASPALDVASEPEQPTKNPAAVHASEGELYTVQFD